MPAFKRRKPVRHETSQAHHYEPYLSRISAGALVHLCRRATKVNQQRRQPEGSESTDVQTQVGRSEWTAFALCDRRKREVDYVCSRLPGVLVRMEESTR